MGGMILGAYIEVDKRSGAPEYENQHAYCVQNRGYGAQAQRYTVKPAVAGQPPAKGGGKTRDVDQ